MINIMRNVDTEYSYDWFLKSFKKNWKKHIESLIKYEGNKEIAIFLVEYKGAPLNIRKNGNFREFYKIYKDNTLVDFLSNYKDQIKYVIYLDTNCCQIMQISKIVDTIKPLPKGYEFGTGRMIVQSTNLFFDIKDLDEF